MSSFSIETVAARNSKKVQGEHSVSTIGKLKLGKVNIKLLSSRIDGTVLVDCLNSFGRETKTDSATQLLAEETLPLKIDFLHLFDSPVGERDNSGLTVWPLIQQVAKSGSHLHVSSAASYGSLLFKEIIVAKDKMRTKPLGECTGFN